MTELGLRITDFPPCGNPLLKGGTISNRGEFPLYKGGAEERGGGFFVKEK